MLKNNTIYSKKGFSAKLFIACLAVIILSFVIYLSAIYYFKFADKKNCKKNIQKLQYAVNELGINETINFSLLSDELKNKLNEYFHNKIPKCPNNGSYILDSTGNIYCSVHNPDAEIIIKTHKNNGIIPKKVKKKVKKKVVKIKKKILAKHELYYRKSLQNFRANNYGKSISFIKQAIELSPKNINYRTLLGTIYFNKKNYAKAIDIFKTILNIKPDNYKAVSMINKINNIIFFQKKFSDNYFKNFRIYYTKNGPVEKSSSICFFDISSNKTTSVIENLTNPVFSIFNKTKKILFSNQGKLFISELNGNNSKLYLDNLECNTTKPIISPDENFFTFCSYRGYNKQVLCIYNTKKNELDLFTEANYNISSPSWSPDSRHISFCTTANNKSEVFIIDNKGLNDSQLTKNDFFDGYPSWALRRDKIAFASKNGINSKNGELYNDIFLMNSDGSEKINLTNSPEVNEILPKWSPKDNYISFIAITEKNLELCVYNTKTRRIKAITSFGNSYDMGFMFFPPVSWFPNEKLITFSYGTESNKDIYIVDILTGNFMAITNSHHFNECYPNIYYPSSKNKMKTFKLFN